MSLPCPRVFVSSVMDNCGNVRAAAAQGVRKAGCEPVLAEGFAAASASPRNACLDGVRSADAVVLLLGARYGFVTPSSLAATEEEYEEARRNNKRILVFLEADVQREPQQQAFADKVQNYVHGHWRKTFRDAAELTELVRDAVTAADLVVQSSARQSQARVRIDTALNSRPPRSDDVVWLQAVWTTLRDEEVVDPLALGNEAFKRRFLRSAHECEPSLLTYEQSKQVNVTPSCLRIDQGDRNNWMQARHLVAVELHSNGTLAIARNITGSMPSTAATAGWSDMFFLDPEVVRAGLNQAWSFVSACWEDLDRYVRHDPLLYNVAIYDMGTRKFASAPQQSHSSIEVPPACPENPLVVFDPPRRVSRADVTMYDKEVDRAITILDRTSRQWTHWP